MRNVHLMESVRTVPERRFFDLVLITLIGLWLLLASSIPLRADQSDPEAKDDAKQLSGMSIVGNDDAPKSLYIVPWKSSEVGMETAFGMVLNNRDVPVDRDVFMRQLNFYQVSAADPTSITPVAEKKE